MTLSSGLRVEALADLITATDLSAPSAPLRYRKNIAWSDGTGAGQADLIFHDTRELAASATEDLDLSGVLSDALGGAASFARVKGLIIAAAKTNTNNVVVGAAATNAWATLLNATGTITLRPGASIAIGTGAADAVAYAVTAGTGDLLKVANSGAGSVVTYDVVIIGASA